MCSMDVIHRPGREAPCSQSLFWFRRQTADGPDPAVSYLRMTRSPDRCSDREQVERPRLDGEIPSFRMRRRPPHGRLLASADGAFRGLMHPQTSIK